MKTIESTGKTTELAIETGLNTLGVTLEQVDVEILSQGGIFAKPKVRLTVKETEGQKALKFIETLMEKLKVTSVAELTEDQESAKIDIIGADIGFLIGYRGEVLDALQYLASLIGNKGKETYKRLVVDGEGYRDKRTAVLEELAIKLADKAVRLKQSVAVEPMNPFERRVMHAKLQDNDGVTTHSEGEEPNRYLVITPKGVTPSAPRTGYNNRGNQRGGYESRDNNRGGYNRDNNRGGGFNRENNGRPSAGRDNNRGGYSRDNNRGGGYGRDNNRGGFNNNRPAGGKPQSGFDHSRPLNSTSGFSDIGVGTKSPDAPKSGFTSNRQFAFRSTNKRPSPYSSLSGFEDNSGAKKSKFDKE